MAQVQKIIIIGASTAAQIMHAYVARDARYEVVAFSVEQDYIDSDSYCGLPVVALEQLSEEYEQTKYQVLLAVGYSELNALRARLFAKVKALGFTALTYIHPDAKVYTDVIGEGSVIMANTVVEVFVEIGDNSIVWANCVIGHHTKIANHCWIASGSVLAGSASLGDYGFMGVNATVANEVNVAAQNIIGANTAILKHTQANQVYLSHQGEKIRFNAVEYAQHLLK